MCFWRVSVSISCHNYTLQLIAAVLAFAPLTRTLVDSGLVSYPCLSVHYANTAVYDRSNATLKYTFLFLLWFSYHLHFSHNDIWI